MPFAALVRKVQQIERLYDPFRRHVERIAHELRVHWHLRDCCGRRDGDNGVSLEKDLPTCIDGICRDPVHGVPSPILGRVLSLLLGDWVVEQLFVTVLR